MFLTALKDLLIKNADSDPVREVTFVGETNNGSYLYVIQQQTSLGVKNYCISVNKNSFEALRHELVLLKGNEIYVCIKDKLVFEPFVENDFEKVISILKSVLSDADIRKYSLHVL